MTTPSKLAERGTLISIFVYILIACLKIAIGTLYQSSALSADGWNNFTDVLSSIAIFIGIKISVQPADDEHRYGHWKIESISGLTSSFIMFVIGLQVLFSAVQSLLSPVIQPFDPLLFWTGILSGCIISIAFFYNNHLAKQTQSAGLKATAKNNLSDVLSSFITALSLLLIMWFNLYWIDGLMASIVALIILHTAMSIFKENVFMLSDGFDTKELDNYRILILSHPEIRDIRLLKARHYGANIYVDVTVLMDPHLTVKESHAITEDIEQELHKQFHVTFTDVHVEPSSY